MRGCRFPWNRDRAQPHLQMDFPPLDTKEALLLWDFLEQIIEALWQAHGHAMELALPDFLEHDEQPEDDDLYAEHLLELIQEEPES